MIQELATLCMSDIVRLLGALGLLSLGITLTLWGLKRRRRGAILIALFLCLVALVPVALADHVLPPEGSLAQIQTNGPNSPISWGDWYTSNNPSGGGPGYHSFEIYVPCTLDPAEAITVELFDPESNNTAADDLDEIYPGAGDEDDTTFTLWAPDGATIVATQTYTPGGGTSQDWDLFAAFTPGDYDCGIYELTTSTSNDDQNAWRLRIAPDDPDGTPGTGDEISLGTMETAFQHNPPGGCQEFYFLVPDTPSIRLSNFDMDGSGTVSYTDPSGTVYGGTGSTGTVWNNSTVRFYPPPGGDEFIDPEPGVWMATLCVPDDNQYVFDTGGLPYFYDKPITPDMTVGKDDGTTTYYPGGELEYTITYANADPPDAGAALDAVLTDMLPPSTTFLSCSGGQSCGETSPGSGIVTFSLGTVAAGGSGSVTLRVQVAADAPTGTLTNTVELDYSDVLFSDYPVLTATDVNSYTEAPPEPPTPGPEPSGPGPSGPEPAPTPTPIPPTPVPPTPTVEVVTVARLPETGGLPGWFTVVIGIPILIGVAGLLNLALLEMRGRRGDGERG
jgi:uncharacterized repeat protein (TIGR01451 family)